MLISGDKDYSYTLSRIHGSPEIHKTIIITFQPLHKHPVNNNLIQSVDYFIPGLLAKRPRSNHYPLNRISRKSSARSKPQERYLRARGIDDTQNYRLPIPQQQPSVEKRATTTKQRRPIRVRRRISSPSPSQQLESGIEKKEDEQCEAPKVTAATAVSRYQLIYSSSNVIATSANKSTCTTYGNGEVSVYYNNTTKTGRLLFRPSNVELPGLFQRIDDETDEPAELLAGAFNDTVTCKTKQKKCCFVFPGHVAAKKFIKLFNEMVKASGMKCIVI